MKNQQLKFKNKDLAYSIIIGDSKVDELLADKLNIKFYKVNFKSNLLKIVKRKL